MQSSLYPNIFFLKNENLAFLGSVIAEKEEVNLLHPSDPLTNHYASLVFRLFREIKLMKNMLWIAKLPSTDIVRIYFSEPYEYPAANCCRKPVVVEIDKDRCGVVRCSNCRKEVLRFVRGGKGTDQELFRITQKQMKVRKDELRDLLTSLKFRGRKLRNNFMSDSISTESELIVEINQKMCEPREYKSPEPQLSSSLLQLKEIINDIFK